MVKLMYIDPGSGSLIFQALLSGLLTIVIFFKRILLYLKFIFRKKNNEEDVEIENLDNGEPK